MMERCKTGITEMDKMLNGGFLEGSVNLITGECGTGKTTFALQYLYNGATKFNEPGIYIALEENQVSLWWIMDDFSWDMTTLEKQGKLLIYTLEAPSQATFRYVIDVMTTIRQLAERIKAKRLVIDSITTFGIWLQNENLVRRSIYELSSKVKEWGVTTLITSEIPRGTQQLGWFGVEDYLSDSVVKFTYDPGKRDFERSLRVIKMKGSDHEKGSRLFEINKGGINVLK